MNFRARVSGFDVTLVALRSAARSTMRPSSCLEKIFDLLDGGQRPVAALDLQYAFDASPIREDRRLFGHHVGDILSCKDAHDQIRQKPGIDLLFPQKTLRLCT